MIFFKSKKPLKVLFVTSEAAPFAKVGGLGEVMFSLSRALRKIGLDVRVMLPRYASIDPAVYHLEKIYDQLGVPTAPQNNGQILYCNVFRFNPTSDLRSPVTTYFLENREYYEMRSNAYGYVDDRIRFALLCRGALEFFNAYSDWRPEVIVGTDWEGGFLPCFLRTDYAEYKNLKSIATVFSIHNLGNQGTKIHHRFIPELERDSGQGPIPDFFTPAMDNINGVWRGIRYSDVINTVSPTHVKEIMTEEFGEGVDALLRERRDRVFGILNGIDLDTNNPANDSFISTPFDSKNSEARARNKIALQEHFGLPKNEHVFVMGVVARLTRQKGFTLFPPIIEPFLKITKAQLIVVGSGDTQLMEFFQELEKKYPEQVRAHLQYSETLPHIVNAGSDVILVPSYYEPSGLTQMEAMRYGAIPVARRTGGLADTIEDYAPESGQGSGFLFDEFDSNAFLIALTRAFVNWRHRGTWKKLQRRVMMKDFSWERSAREYEKLFRHALKLRADDLSKKTSA